MRPAAHAVTCILLALLLALTGCGGGSKDSSSRGHPPVTGGPGGDNGNDDGGGDAGGDDGTGGNDGGGGDGDPDGDDTRKARYQVVDFNDIDEGPWHDPALEVTALSNTGWVAGRDGSGAVLFRLLDDRIVTYRSSLDGSTIDVNDQGSAAGYIEGPAGLPDYVGFVVDGVDLLQASDWPEEHLTYIESKNWGNTRATDLNEESKVVGIYEAASNGFFGWKQSGVEDLGTLGAEGSPVTILINDSGAMAFSMKVGDTEKTIWEDALGVRQGPHPMSLTSYNNPFQVGGCADGTPVISDGTQLIRIDPKARSGCVSALNDGGDAVGNFESGGAFAYLDDTFYEDVNLLLRSEDKQAGYVVTKAVDINALGQILAYAKAGGMQTIVLLDPLQ